MVYEYVEAVRYLHNSQWVNVKVNLKVKLFRL